MIQNEFSTYQGSSINSIPEGFGTKSYKSGFILQGLWKSGHPQGIMTIKSLEYDIQVTFKKGKIFIVHFRGSLANYSFTSIFFPFKFIKINSNFYEIPVGIDEGHYSAFKIGANEYNIRNVVNRKLKNLKKLLYNDHEYHGETNEQGIPSGFGILKNSRCYYLAEFDGYFCCKGYCLIDITIFKGNFVDLKLQGMGKEKILLYGIESRGRFENFIKHGKFDVKIEGFRMEVFYENNKHLNPIKYFKEEKFLYECNATKILFIPEVECYHIPEMLELLQILQSKILCAGLEFHKILTKDKKENKNFFIRNHSSQDWVTYERKIYRKISALSLESDDIIKSLKFDNGSQYKGQVINRKLNGWGKFLYNNGDCYIGYFIDDKREGFGSFFKNGRIFYKGYWKEDKFHSKGKIFLEDFIIVGQWENGNLSGVVKSIQIGH